MPIRRFISSSDHAADYRRPDIRSLRKSFLLTDVRFNPAIFQPMHSKLTPCNIEIPAIFFSIFIQVRSKQATGFVIIQVHDLRMILGNVTSSRNETTLRRPQPVYVSSSVNE